MRICAAVLTLCSALSLGVSRPAQPGQAPGQPGQPQMPAGHPGVPTVPDWPKADPADVASIDAILKAMYAATAGEPGQARNWDRYKSLFVPDARLIASRPGAEGGAAAMYLTIGEYVQVNRNYFEKGGLVEREAGRRVQEYGNIAHVWSVYETRHRADDPAPYVRGINSVQLLRDGDRWWIVNLFWDFERETNPIPERFLGFEGE